MLRLLGFVHDNNLVVITSLFLKRSENETLAQRLNIKNEKCDQGIYSTCKDS